MRAHFCPNKLFAFIPSTRERFSSIETIIVFKYRSDLLLVYNYSAAKLLPSIRFKMVHYFHTEDGRQMRASTNCPSESLLGGKVIYVDMLRE